MEAPFKLHQQTDQFTPNPDINASYWSVQADLLADIIDSQCDWWTLQKSWSSTIKIILFTGEKKNSADLHETSFLNLPLTGRMYSDMLDLINKQLLKLQN